VFHIKEGASGISNVIRALGDVTNYINPLPQFGAPPTRKKTGGTPRGDFGTPRGDFAAHTILKKWGKGHEVMVQKCIKNGSELVQEMYPKVLKTYPTNTPKP
jgi:hypothetical protein